MLLSFDIYNKQSPLRVDKVASTIVDCDRFDSLLLQKDRCKS